MEVGCGSTDSKWYNQYIIYYIIWLILYLLCYDYEAKIIILSLHHSRSDSYAISHENHFSLVISNADSDNIKTFTSINQPVVRWTVVENNIIWYTINNEYKMLLNCMSIIIFLTSSPFFIYELPRGNIFNRGWNRFWESWFFRKSIKWSYKSGLS